MGKGWLSDPKKRASFAEICLYVLLMLLMPLFQIGLAQIFEWLR